MKIFGAVSRLTGIFFRKNSNDVGLRANQATTYTATRNSDLPPGDTDHVLVSANSTQVLTNKDIDGGTASNTSRITVPKGLYSSLLLLTRKEGTILYATDLDQFYSDDGTNLNPIGSGSAGGINYIDAPSTATGWSFTTNFGTSATTQTAGDLPLGGTIETAILLRSVGVNTEALENASYSFTTPEVGGVKTPVSFFMRPGTGFASNEWTISIYQGSTRQPLSTDSSSITYIPNTSGQFVTTFMAVKNTTYTVRFSRINGSGTAVLNVAQVFVGLQAINQGAAVQYLGQLTLTPVGFGVTSAGRWDAWRIGDRMKISGRWTSGTPSGSNASLTLPAGYTINTASMGSSSLNVGVWVNLRPTSGTIYSTDSGGIAFYDGSTTNTIFFTDNTGASSGVYEKRAGNVVASIAGGYDVNFELPIAEWAGSGTVNLAQNDVQFASDDGTSDIYGPNGSPVPNQAFNTGTTTLNFAFPNGLSTTDAYVLELSTGTGFPFAPAADIFPYFQGNNGTSNNVYGMRGYFTSATNYEAKFGSQGTKVDASNASNGTTAWSTLFAAGARYRLRRSASGQAVGFGEVVPGQSSGLVASAGLKGRTDGGTVAAGYVGQQLVSAVTAVSVSNVGFTNVTSLAVTAGTWLLTGSVMNNGANGNTYIAGGISPTSASITGTTSGYDRFIGAVVSTSGVGQVAIPGKYITISATTTYYLVAQMSTVSSNCDGFIQAVRVA